jgi:hypothetical protein
MNERHYCPYCGYQFKYEIGELCPGCNKKTNINPEWPHFCTICGNHFEVDHFFPISNCNRCGHSTKRSNDFNLKQTLIENSSLFVIFGVFIALSMYLFQFISIGNANIGFFSIGTTKIAILDITIGTSLFIALIILLIFLNDLLKLSIIDDISTHFSNNMRLFPFGLMKRYLLGLLLSLIFLGILGYVYIKYVTVVSFLLALLMACISVILFLYGAAIITNLTFPKKEKSNVRKPIIIYDLIYSAVLFLISDAIVKFYLIKTIETLLIKPVQFSILSFFYVLNIISALGIFFCLFFLICNFFIRRHISKEIKKSE